MSTTKSDSRLVARVSTELHQMVSDAADLSGATITQFLISAATEKASKVIEDMSVIHLSKADTEAVFNALENPAKPNKELRQLWKNYQGSGLYELEDRAD